MILRDTSIREQLSSSIKESSSFNINSNYNSSTFLSRERDCSSPYLSSSNCGSSNNQSRENNVALLRENHLVHNTPRVASNRLLSGGLDQRIIKQSTEDCRRLLQQVRFITFMSFSDLNITGRVNIKLMLNLNSLQAIAVVDTTRGQQLAPTFKIPPPSETTQSAQGPQDGASQAFPSSQIFNHPQRILTSSSSFDSKSNMSNFSPFNMSAEAARLFQTLQQSPLPLPQQDVINFC